MIDGLEISEINFSEMFFENRLDSEYFLKNILIKDAMLDKLNSIKIGSFSYVTDGIHESIEFDEKSNINLISAKAPKKNYFDLSGTGFISRNQNEQNPRTQLQHNDIIISTVGTIGNCAVVNEEVLPSNSDRHVGIVRLNSGCIIKPRYLSTFILSKFGQYQTKRFTTGNVQPNLFIYKIKDIKVPIISDLWQNKIERIVLQAEELLKDSKKCYKLAEKLLMDKLNIKIYSTNLVSIKTLSDSFYISGRLDAEYYQPKYEQIENQIASNNTVYNSCKIYDKNFNPNDDIIYQYIELANVDLMGGIATPSSIIGKELPSRARRLVKTGQIIISSIEGSLQSCALITEQFNNAICSTGFFVLDSEKYNPETLLVLFKSEPIQELLKKRCSGTILTAISKDELEKMPLPELDKGIQEQIAEKVQESFRLRKKSKELLDIAVKAVEMAIETDEETAIAWMKEQGV